MRHMPNRAHNIVPRKFLGYACILTIGNIANSRSDAWPHA